jgi:hypothetical protein
MKILHAFLLLVCVSPVLYAQQQAAGTTGQPRCRPCPRRMIKTAPTALSTSQPAPDFYVGEAKVDVVKDQTVVRLAMAQHGSVLIEVPANDGPRYIIPGDPEMATVDQKALERNKRAIIVRPGTLFVPPARSAKARTPAATVTAQMRSGLVVTFLFYPVQDLAQNVHRCVLSYNRDEVVARRRAAGLPVNLDVERREEMTVQSDAPTTISVESTSDNEKKTPSPSPLASPSEPAKSPKPGEEPKINRTASPNEETKTKKEAEAVTYIRGALQQAIKQPEEFKQWTRSSNGLKLSQVSVPVVGYSYSLAIIAIKNTTNNSLKFAASNPDLVIETVNDQGKPVNIESLKYLHVEASGSTQTIPAQGTAYYAVAYSPPVLGTHQQIRVFVAHSNAADQPASIVLNNGGK